MKQHTWIVGAVAAMLIAAPSVKAQDATSQGATSPVALTATDVTGIPVITAPDAIDYSVLRNEPFTISELNAAEARGFTDSEIASAAKVAKETYQPFSAVIADMERGTTFATLSTKYGIPIADIYDVSDETAKIADYKKAVMTTGFYALKAMKMDAMASDATAPGSMAPSATPAATTPMAPAAPTGDIVDVASADPNLSTLVQAIQAAGLVDTLKGTGPFTVFAPTNAAFKRLPKGALAALLADPTALKNVLTYHVIAGQKIDAATAMSMTSPTSPPTVEGGTLQVVTSGGKVRINNATVTKADIQATNGIIHVINRVLMPPAAPAAPATP